MQTNPNIDAVNRDAKRIVDLTCLHISECVRSIASSWDDSVVRVSFHEFDKLYALIHSDSILKNKIVFRKGNRSAMIDVDREVLCDLFLFSGDGIGYITDILREKEAWWVLMHRDILLSSTDTQYLVSQLSPVLIEAKPLVDMMRL